MSLHVTLESRLELSLAHVGVVDTLDHDPDVVLLELPHYQQVIEFPGCVINFFSFELTSYYNRPKIESAYRAIGV